MRVTRFFIAHTLCSDIINDIMLPFPRFSPSSPNFSPASRAKIPAGIRLALQEKKIALFRVVRPLSSYMPSGSVILTGFFFYSSTTWWFHAGKFSMIVYWCLGFNRFFFGKASESEWEFTTGWEWWNKSLRGVELDKEEGKKVGQKWQTFCKTRKRQGIS